MLLPTMCLPSEWPAAAGSRPTSRGSDPLGRCGALALEMLSAASAKVQHVVHGPLEMLVQGPLGVDERLRRLPGDPLGQGECLVKARPVGHHPVRQPEFHGVLGDDAIAGEQILLGPQKARHGWPRQVTTVGRHQAHRDVRVGQVGALLNQDDIAEPGQGTAEPDGRAVHGGDHREPEPDEPLHDLARLAEGWPP